MSSKYDMRINPMYQVDFSTTSEGKHFGGTKQRRVHFKFGFSDPNALKRGLQGIHCRGEEHEVTLVWSVSSGKRVVFMDNLLKEQVHFSVAKKDKHFDCSWIASKVIMKLVAHASNFNQPEGFRQFDLLLDGMSFFDLPKIYELGVVDAASAIINKRGGGGVQEHNDGSFAFSPFQSPGYDGYNEYNNDNGQNSYSNDNGPTSYGNASRRYSLEAAQQTNHYIPTTPMPRRRRFFRAKSTAYDDMISSRREKAPAPLRRAKSLSSIKIRKGTRF